MELKGIAAGFVAGIAMAGGAVLLLREQAAPPEPVQIGELKAQVDRLETAVSNLSALVSRPPRDAAKATAPSSAPSAPAASPSPAQIQAAADADALVEQGLQSGRWSMQQADELSAAVSDLDVGEQGRILARVSKAINDGQMHFDPDR